MDAKFDEAVLQMCVTIANYTLVVCVAHNSWFFLWLSTYNFPINSMSQSSDIRGVLMADRNGLCLTGASFAKLDSLHHKFNITLAKGEAVASASGYIVAAVQKAIADSGSDDAGVCIQTDK